VMNIGVVNALTPAPIKSTTRTASRGSISFGGVDSAVAREGGGGVAKDADALVAVRGASALAPCWSTFPQTRQNFSSLATFLPHSGQKNVGTAAASLTIPPQEDEMLVKSK
jgi:hypothetical protein